VTSRDQCRRVAAALTPQSRRPATARVESTAATRPTSPSPKSKITVTASSPELHSKTYIPSAPPSSRSAAEFARRDSSRDHGSGGRPQSDPTIRRGRQRAPPWCPCTCTCTSLRCGAVVRTCVPRSHLHAHAPACTCAPCTDPCMHIRTARMHSHRRGACPLPRTCMCVPLRATRWWHCATVPL